MRALVGTKIPMARLDDAVARILTVKCQMGLGTERFLGSATLDSVGSAGHRALARRAVAESLVLLKNQKSLLPLNRDTAIEIAGSHANDIGLQSGGWTIEWQGKSGAITEGTTLLQGFRELSSMPEKVTVLDPQKPLKSTRTVIYITGEEPYAEMKGDSENLALPQSVIDDLKALKKQNKQVILILLSGRPLILGDAEKYSDAIVAAWLPGSEGAGVADVLFGSSDFTGKLSRVWPQSMDQLPLSHDKTDRSYQYDYGFGLNYADGNSKR